MWSQCISVLFTEPLYDSLYRLLFSLIFWWMHGVESFMKMPNATSVCILSVRSTKQEMLTFIKLIKYLGGCGVQMVSMHATSTPETTVCFYWLFFFLTMMNMRMWFQRKQSVGTKLTFVSQQHTSSGYKAPSVASFGIKFHSLFSSVWVSTNQCCQIGDFLARFSDF